MNGDCNIITMPCEGLIDRVIENFKYQVVQTRTI